MYSPELMKFLVNYNMSSSRTEENSNEQNDSEGEFSFRFAKITSIACVKEIANVPNFVTVPIMLKK